MNKFYPYIHIWEWRMWLRCYQLNVGDTWPPRCHCQNVSSEKWRKAKNRYFQNSGSNCHRFTKYTYENVLHTVRNSNTVLKNSLSFHKGLKTQGNCQLWSLIAATQIVCVTFSMCQAINAFPYITVWSQSFSYLQAGGGMACIWSLRLINVFHKFFSAYALVLFLEPNLNCSFDNVQSEHCGFITRKNFLHFEMKPEEEFTFKGMMHVEIVSVFKWKI